MSYENAIEFQAYRTARILNNLDLVDDLMQDGHELYRWMEIVYLPGEGFVSLFNQALKFMHFKFIKDRIKKSMQEPDVFRCLEQLRIENNFAFDAEEIPMFDCLQPETQAFLRAAFDPPAEIEKALSEKRNKGEKGPRFENQILDFLQIKRRRKHDIVEDMKNTIVL